MAALQNKLEQISLRVEQSSPNIDSHKLNTVQPTSRTTQPPNSPPSNTNKNGNEHSDQIEPGGRTVSPESSRVEPSQPPNTEEHPVDEQERFDKQFKQSEELSDQQQADNPPLNSSQVYDSDNTHKLDDREQEHNSTKEPSGEEQTMDYNAEQYGAETNQDYVDPNQQYDQQYVDPNQQYTDEQYQEQPYDPNQQYDPNQYDPNQQYDENYVDPNQQYENQ
ncbi:uncharacterized protein LOC143909025 [Arctopsyche grandis]|uniref:uncharacterized protein LOC143909025 n=1 Tax=Arctopsyche grandis TaxID=121162 RepID=UPI00406D8A85